MRKRVIILVVFILILFLAFSFMRLRNSVAINAESREDITLSSPIFRQDDIKWGNEFLGSSSYTMKKSGCLTTCIASALNISPKELNTAFSENNVYDNEGNIQWSELEKVGISVNVLSYVSEKVIYESLENGHFPIVRVRVNGGGNFHYVLITGVENGKYICMDPLKDEYTYLSDYWNMVYAVRVVY